MTPDLDRIHRVIRAARRRWFYHTVFRATVRAAVPLSLLCAGAATWARLGHVQDPARLAAISVIALAIAGAATSWGLWPLRRRPSNGQVARFIEERCPQLEDRLASAVECSSHPDAAVGPVLAGLLCRDAADRVAHLDLDETISRAVLVRGAIRASLAMLALAIACGGLAPIARRAGGTFYAFMFPSVTVLHVSPGSVHLPVGTPLRVQVTVEHLFGGATPLLEMRSRRGIVRSVMRRATGARFDLVIARVTGDFTYAVTAGRAVSNRYAVIVRQPPRVTRIDVAYQYPPALRLAAREEQNGGDIYAPAGTNVRLRIYTDRKVQKGALVLDDGTPRPLTPLGDALLETQMTVTTDGSYRVALSDDEGVAAGGDTEYFIRVLADTPPDVRIVEPAADRQVAPLEEVKIAAHAEDDHGVKTFDLVYAVSGGPEKVVPFATSGGGQSVDGSRLLYLEDLQVRPGDFVTYYARARDGTGVASNEARSDIFFLQVTPFGQEFMPPQSQAGNGGPGMDANGTSLDDLVRAQKEIVVATWKLDRRARQTRGGRSQDDVRTVARAQGELRTRASETAGPAFAPERAARQSGAGGGSAGSAGGDSMSNAIEAMGRAEQALDQVSTSEALPHETRALNELMRAQASQRRWQMRQAAGAGAGSDNGNSSADLTTLFDNELKREQRTNYEMPLGADRAQQKPSEALERLRQIAQRQGDLSQLQQELERDRSRMSPDDFKRQLERLTREQSELRQQAEELAQRTKSGAAAGKSPGSRAAANGGSVSEASDAMRQAANSLREGKVGDASRQSGQALDKLRSAERQMSNEARASAGPSLGDLRMEAQQAADAEQSLARQSAAAGTGRQAADTMRRLAGEKERLAEQVGQLQQDLKRAAASSALEDRQRQAIGAVTTDLDHLQLPQRMRESAAAMRDAAKADVNRPESAGKEADLAKTLSRLADRIGAATAGDRGEREAERQLDSVRAARERLAQLERQMQELQRQADAGNTSAGSRATGMKGDSGNSGKPAGTSGTGTASDPASALNRVRDEYVREVRRAAEEMDRVSRQAGVAPTPDGQQAILSAPGFHQDYSTWEQLAREVNNGLERAETALGQKVREEQARDQLQATASEQVPEPYRRLVEQYYRALAADAGGKAPVTPSKQNARRKQEGGT